MNFVIDMIIPMFILVVITIGLKEKKDIFKLFTEGALDGAKIVYKIFPFILAITIAIGLLNSTGSLDIILKPIIPVLRKFNIPSDVVPLFIVRPLSGGASMSFVIDILKTYGPDSISGKIATIIMGATETTLYTITILFGTTKMKKIRGVLIAGLIADIVEIISTVMLVNIGIV